MTPRQAQRELEALTERMTQATFRALHRTAHDMYQMLVSFTSGTRTRQEMKEADHPYARRHGSPLWDPREVNILSGDFSRAWEIGDIYDDPSTNSYGIEVFNVDPKAPYLDQREGSPETAMFERRPVDLLGEVPADILDEYLDEELSNVFNGTIKE